MKTLNVTKQPLKTLVAAIAVASTFASFPAYSLQITASNTWTVGTNASQTDIDGPASSGFVDVLAGDSDSNGNSVFYHTFGNTSGNFGSRSSGDGTFDISGLYTFNENYTATGGAATFDFNIIPGEISVFGNLTGSDSLFAGYSLEIFLNGGSIWDSSANIQKDLSGTVFTETGGTSLAGTLSGDTYSFGPFSDTLNLGSFSAGTAINISYALTTQATGNISSLDCVFDGGFGGELGIEFEGEFDPNGGEGSSCGSIARIGDPNGLNQGNTSAITGAVPDTAVPEPTSIALLGLGLIGFGFSRKNMSNH